MNESTAALPTAVIGAGPVGLAAAAHLTARKQNSLVLEAGPSAGTAVREWSHVRLFSSWAEVIDPAAEKLLAPTGWIRPDDGAYPSGGDWAERYLQPLADVLGDRVRYGSRVTGVSRSGRDRVVDAGRDEQPFTVHLVTADGTEERITARAVIDASGTWAIPSPLGSDGLPAPGEREVADRITYRIPDLNKPAVRARYAGKRTAVIGSGSSAFTALAQLAGLAKEHPGTHASWILRRGIGENTFGGGEADELPARGALGLRAKAAVEDGYAEAVTGFRTAAVEQENRRVVLVAEDGRRLEPVDEVIVVTGLRPDLSFLDELRLGLDERLQAPVELAPLIDPNVHSCGTVYPHGEKELAHPEKNLYLVGMKSYGRAPTFLAMTGFEQVRSIAAHLAGDQEAARRVELTLPETGVCGGAGLDESDPTRRITRDLTKARAAAPLRPPFTSKKPQPRIPPAAADPNSPTKRRYTMSRLQLALRVPDLDTSVAFYSRLFGTEPAKLRDGYANFAIAEPPLKLVLIEGEPGEETRMDHLGVEVESSEAVSAATARLGEAGLNTHEENDTTCCYALQDKVWVHGPGKEPWEVYVVKADADSLTRQKDSTCCTDPGSDSESREAVTSGCC